ncbi:MAG: TolC family protein [Mucinivorans sp.]
MKKAIFTLVGLMLILPMVAQDASSIEAVLAQVEANNYTLKAAADQQQAQSLTALSGISLQNPEVEFGYLWGSPSTPGNRFDFSVKQGLDFPSVYVQKKKIATLEESISKTEYRATRREILLSAHRCCIELIYLNALEDELTLRAKDAAQLAESYRKSLAQGNATALENNKAQKSLLAINGQLQDITSQRTSALNLLQQLNGGQAIVFTDSTYQDNSSLSAMSSFDEWFESTAQKSPVLQYLAQQIAKSERQVKLSNAQGLPQFTFGYRSEAVIAGEQFQGFIAGMSIPMWGNKNNVKAAKASLRAARSSAQDQKMIFYEQLRTLYERAAALEKIDRHFHNTYSKLTNVDLLKKALSTGEISLLDYLVELSLNYSLIDQDLITERDLHLALSELLSFEL